MGKGAPEGSGHAKAADTIQSEVFFARTSLTHDGVELFGKHNAQFHHFVSQGMLY